MNTLLNTYNFTINEGSTTLKKRYPMLVGSPFVMDLLTNENENFQAVVTFNQTTEWLRLMVYQGNDVVQGETHIRDFPNNLLLCDELNEYGLFFFMNEQQFKFYHLETWYKTTFLTYGEMYERIKNKTI